MKWYSKLCSTKYPVGGHASIGPRRRRCRWAMWILCHCLRISRFLLLSLLCLRLDSGLHLFAMLSVGTHSMHRRDYCRNGVRRAYMHFELMRKATFIASSFAFYWKSCKIVSKHKEMEQTIIIIITIIIARARPQQRLKRTAMYAKCEMK